RLFGGRTVMRFGAGKVFVDSARFESTAGELTAGGALGLTSAVSDTPRFQFTADSLGGFRRYLARHAAVDAIADSLAGTLRATGVITGQPSRFALDARLDGDGLRIRTTTARTLRGTFALSTLPDSATGTITLRFDALRSGTTVFNDAELRADVAGGWQA